MITITFTNGQKVTIPGATKFVTESGMTLEFSGNEALPANRQLKLTKKEKWAALAAWIPKVWPSCDGDLAMLAAQARADGFYAAGGGDCQMLWSVMRELGLMPGEKKEAA